METHLTPHLSDSTYPFCNGPSTLAIGTSKVSMIIDENEPQSNNLSSDNVNRPNNISVSDKNIMKSSLMNNTLSSHNYQNWLSAVSIYFRLYLTIKTVFINASMLITPVIYM